MAHDMKKLKTLKWLEKLSSKRITGLDEPMNPYRQNVFARFGRFYATNGYILADVEYPEHTHDADDEWQAIAHYQDDKGYLLPTVEYFKPEICDRMRDRVFEDMFIKSIALDWDSSQAFNPALIAECMQPFKINGICPSMAMLGDRLEFAGHNKDVSIKVLMIGVRK